MVTASMCLQVLGLIRNVWFLTEVKWKIPSLPYSILVKATEPLKIYLDFTIRYDMLSTGKRKILTADSRNILHMNIW